MKLNVPYFNQETEHTCGHAVLRMVLAFFGVTRTEAEMLKEIGENPDKGTPPDSLIAVGKKEGFYTFAKEHSPLEDINKMIAAGLPVIVSYILPGEEVGHYAVVVGVENNQLIFNDPKVGKDWELSVEEFSKRWYGQFDGEKQWMLVISNKPF